MKKISAIIVCLATLFTVNREKNNAINYSARSYLVMDYNNGQVLESKSSNLIRSVASISKIMTAIVAIENSDIEEQVQVNDDILKSYGSSIYLQVGEVIKMEELLYGLMLRSGNDAAITIARKVSGSVSEFVSVMNKKAIDIGMKNTTFNNPSGLDIDDEGNVSTSYDMALLMRYAMHNPLFKKIVSAKEYRSTNHGIWTNKNKLLKRHNYITGGKTGFTGKARRTLVTSGEKDDMSLIVVTLDCGNDFEVHERLYEKYFYGYKTFKLLKEGSNHFEEYEITCDEIVTITINKDELAKYQIIYRIQNEEVTIELNGLESKDVIAKCKAKQNKVKKKKKKIFNMFFWVHRVLDIHLLIS